MDSNNISLLIIPVKLYFRRCGEGLAHELVEIRVTHFLLTLLLSNSPVCLQFDVSKSNIEWTYATLTPPLKRWKTFLQLF